MNNRAVTYSLLAYIRNNEDFVKGPLDIFIPLIKRSLYRMNYSGIHQGESLLEIKKFVEEDYSIDFPIPVLKTILTVIGKEVNTHEKKSFVLYNDGGFSMNKYIFDEYEELFNSKYDEVKELEKLFIEFKSITLLENIDDISGDSIFKFIEKNRFLLSKYITQEEYINGEDYTIEAQFVQYFMKSKPVFNLIKDIYLGAILSCYIEYQPELIKEDVELVLDTNFVVGLLDLNTPESTHTCRTLLEVAEKNGYSISIFKCTIDETQNLLKQKAQNFNRSFLQSKINSEDVYNACERRNLKQVDLERISDNIERDLAKFNIMIYHNHDTYTKEAKTTETYQYYKSIRKSDLSALHDATVLSYVKRKRKIKIYDFDKVNCWFVNNSSTEMGNSFKNDKGEQPFIIKADDLLNILWLSNPVVSKEISGDDLSRIGLSTTISLTLSKDLPRSKVLKELDENIIKYGKEAISDSDIVRVATRITNKQLTDIECLNELADENEEEFVRRLKEESKKQEAAEQKTAERITEFIQYAKKEVADVSKIKVAFKEIQDESKGLQNENSDLKKRLKDDCIRRKVLYWRLRNWLYCVIAFIFLFLLSLYYLRENNFDINKTYEFVKDNIIFTTLLGLFMWYFGKKLYDIHCNHSNIENYKKSLKCNENT
ncbi:hypothetical protein VSP10_07340 [Myroides odoratimimus]|uniref:hypothetical protein n=1 Tax=Myroides odoratimimus TaxID=76832 RepID=UPI002DBF1601|nr:hypothetical protein [Myroides odoratimimus]MEC4052604.1 hypothetical protein [Myroides odoratimimus]